MTDTAELPRIQASEVERLAQANAEIAGLRDAVMPHLRRYIERGMATDTRTGRVIDPTMFSGSGGNAETMRTHYGYGSWRIQNLFDDDGVLFVHHLADDRGPGQDIAHVKMPWAFATGQMDEEKDRATYLALKARFEPTA